VRVCPILSAATVHERRGGSFVQSRFQVVFESAWFWFIMQSLGSSVPCAVCGLHANPQVRNQGSFLKSTSSSSIHNKVSPSYNISYFKIDCDRQQNGYSTPTSLRIKPVLPHLLDPSIVQRSGYGTCPSGGRHGSHDLPQKQACL
jgi:hypothetical protein